MAERKSEREGTSTLNNTKRVKRSGKGAKNYFQKNAECSHFCWPCKQTAADSLTSTKMRICWKMFPMVNRQKGSLWFITKATRNIPAYQRVKQLDTSSFTSNSFLNSFSSFFTINAYNNFLEVFCVKLIWELKHHFWDTKWCRPNRTTFFASQNLISTKPFV